MSGGVLVRSPHLVWRDEPEEKRRLLAAADAGEEITEKGWVVLVDGGEMHELNLIAGEIWCLADGSRDAAAITRVLAARYEAPEGEIGSDVNAFVADCTARGWLRMEET